MNPKERSAIAKALDFITEPPPILTSGELVTALGLAFYFSSAPRAPENQVLGCAGAILLSHVVWNPIIREVIREAREERLSEGRKAAER